MGRVYRSRFAERNRPAQSVVERVQPVGAPMAATSVPTGTILERLSETPRRIAALTAGMSAAQAQRSPSPDEWCVNDVLAHLRACADVWGGHIEAILAEDEPARQGVNPRTWIKRTNYPDQ